MAKTKTPAKTGGPANGGGYQLKTPEPWHFEQLKTYEGPGTISSVARHLGISPPVYYNFMRMDADFRAAVQELQHKIDDGVESALLKKATGYEFEHTKIGKDGKKVTSIIHVQPDVQAAKFWLVNRRRDRWTERRTVEVEGSFKEMMAKLDDALDVIEAEYEDVTDAEE